jgi:hypothetical protein
MKWLQLFLDSEYSGMGLRLNTYLISSSIMLGELTPRFCSVVLAETQRYFLNPVIATGYCTYLYYIQAKN